MKARVLETDLLATQTEVSDPSLSYTDDAGVRASPAAHVGTWWSCRIRGDMAELQGSEGTRGNCRDQRRHGGAAGIQALRLQTYEASTPACAVNGFALFLLPNYAE